jgi:homoserine kinase
MSSRKIHVFAPATVANVACGFDVMGFAIDAPGDEVIVTLKNSPGIEIKKITGDQGKLPYDPCKNTVGVGIGAYLKHIGSKQGVEIELRKNLPLGSGLGSSAASSVAGVFAINALMENPLQAIDLLPFTMEAERVACGSAHADNVAPALLGGFVLVRSYSPLDVVKIPSPKNLFCTVIHPQVEVRTEDARKILKKGIALSDAIIQWGNVGGLIAGLMMSDTDLIGRSLQDVIIEPIRALLIPGFNEVKQAALDAGALGCSISGSGPSIFALSTTKEIAMNTAQAMQAVFHAINIESERYISTINTEGPRILA